MLSRGWILPDEKQSVVTLEFLHRVHSRQIFSPRAEDVRSVPLCQTPPPQAHLVGKMIQAAGTLETKGEDTAPLERLRGYLGPLREKQADSTSLAQVLNLVDLSAPPPVSNSLYKRLQNGRPLVNLANGESSVAFYKGL